MNKIKQVKELFKVALKGSSEDQSIERFGEHLSPNVRALRLSVSIADVLIASGVAVSDVVTMALDITDRYCSRKVQFDISMTVIMASQDRGNEKEPLTLIRHARPRTQNNMMIQAIQELARDIDHGKVDLEEAEKKFDDIMNHPRKYPYWLTALGSALIAAGVGVMFGASAIITLIMFTIGGIVSYGVRQLTHYRVPSFFTQIISSILITMVAAGVTWAGTMGVEVLQGVNPTLIVIGGIVMLVAGLTIVGAVQDAIDEYYITANARLLKVSMMTAGIVAGVLIGLYFAKLFGIYIAVDSETQPIARGDWQLLGAVIVSIGYAMSMQSGVMSVLASGGIGALAWLLYVGTSDGSVQGGIAASGIAAIVVGFVGTMIARVWRTPSSGLIMAGIVPLVPGLTLYNALLQLVEGSTQSGTLTDGILSLFNAILIALAIASGVSLGIFVGRPIRRTLVRARNALPRQRLN